MLKTLFFPQNFKEFTLSRNEVGHTYMFSRPVCRSSQHGRHTNNPVTNMCFRHTFCTLLGKCNSLSITQKEILVIKSKNSS